MIIDDDKDILNLFSIFLEYNAYSLDAYTNPVEAFNNFRKNSHDLIVLENAKDRRNDIISQN